MQRQYTGTAGKITSCQPGVFLACASPKGRALTDGELYLPRSWSGDEVRLAAAGVPDGTAFRTKPQLLRLMIERAVPAGIPFSGVTADKAYGTTGRCARSSSTRASPTCWRSPATTWSPRPRDRAGPAPWPRPGPGTASAAGTAPRGRRRYDWALLATTRPEITLLVRRSVTRPSELAFYLCHTPQPASLAVLVKAASARWRVKECFQAAKNEAGLDHYQVRLYKAWHRYVTLAMLALAWLAAIRAELAAPDQPGGTPHSWLTTSANEIRRLFTALCGPPPDEQHARRWSRWRHHHQEHAQRCHYRRQRQQDH